MAGVIVAAYDRHEGQEVVVAGRLMRFRKQGGLSFGVLQDQSGSIQLYLRRDTLSPTDPQTGSLGYEDLRFLDLGDFVEACGRVMKTARGEISVLVTSLRILTKALRPLPDKWKGLTDRETILRQRYLDMTMEPGHRVPFEQVARMLRASRAFLDARGFLEFNTPILQPQYGGGTARPFRTRVHALGIDVYLAISHELYLKRLIAAGFDNVYTIGRYFRNEGIDATHHPEFSMIETMSAYQDYTFNMDLIEDLFRYVAKEAFGRTTFKVKGHEVDFGERWARIAMPEAVAAATGVDFEHCASVEEANAYLRTLGIDEPQQSRGHALVRAFEEFVAPKLVQPTIVYGHPMDISPLAKPMASNPWRAERFEIYIAGMECGDNWSEQNDPITLLERWKQHRALHQGKEGEVHPLDYDFIEVLEHGLPPTTGIGPGIERMAMIFTEQENIDDVIVFPLLRPKVSETNQVVYGIRECPSEEPASLRPAHGPEEDIHLSYADLRAALEEGWLPVQGGTVLIQPFVRRWRTRSEDGLWRTTGHIEVMGLLGKCRLIVVGYTRTTATKPTYREAADWFAREILTGLTEAVRARLPGTNLVIRETVCLNDAWGLGEDE